MDSKDSTKFYWNVKVLITLKGRTEPQIYGESTMPNKDLAKEQAAEKALNLLSDQGLI